MAVDNSRKKSTPPRPNLPPEGQPWGRWVTDTLNELKLETGGVKREVISSNKNHNSQLQMSAQQKREIIKANLKAEEALNIALAASGSTTIYFVAPETPEQGDIWYENVTGIWFRWVDDQWVPITDETLLEALEAILAQRIANDDKVRTFAQPDAPTGMTTEHVGDLWYDTDDKNKLYRWDGLEWVPIRDAGITEAQDAADAAQGTADDAKTVADDAKETADTAADVVTQLEAQVTADLGAMQGRLVTAEGELTELENVTLPALDSRLGSAESAVSAAEGRLVTAEGELTDLTTNVLPGITSELGTVSGEVSDHETRMTAAEQAVAAAEGRLVTAEGELATLDSDLSQIDTALSALQTDVDNLVIPSVDGLNKITYSTSAPSATAGYKEGDTWFRYTGTGASRVIYGQWHFTGSVWNEVALRNEMIASLDAGKVTTGFLDAGRIAAKSVTADKLLVGSFDNLIADVVNETGTTAPHAASAYGSLVTQLDSADADGVSPGRHLYAQRIGADDGITRAAMTWGGADGTNRIRVEPGGTYRFSVLTRLGGSYPNGTGYMRLAVREMTASGSYITYLSHGGNHTPNWFWREHVAEFTVGPGTHFVTLEIQMTAVGSNYRLALPQFRQMNAGELIVDGTITGSKIKAGSITASDAVFDTGAIQNADIGNLNATKINAGELDAARIGANSITAEKLLVGGGDNLMPDPKMRTREAWANSSFVQHTGGRSGAGQLVIPASTSTSGAYQSTSNTDRTHMTPVTAGETYYVEVWVRGTATIEAGTNSARVYLRTYPEGEGSFTWPETSGLFPSEDIPADTWELLSGQVTIPDGQSYLSIGLYAQSQYNAEMRWSDPVVRKAVSATLIENGAVTTEKVAADAITGNKIKAGSITATHGVFATGAIQNADIGNLNASKINAGTLNAARIGADTIEGKHIKGGSITASDAVFATGAIKSADIGELVADKITSGTLRAIDIEGVTITGSDIVGGTITGQTTVTSGGSLLVEGGELKVKYGDATVFETTSSGIAVAGRPNLGKQFNARVVMSTLGHSTLPNEQSATIGVQRHTGDPDNPSSGAWLSGARVMIGGQSRDELTDRLKPVSFQTGEVRLGSLAGAFGFPEPEPDSTHVEMYGNAMVSHHLTVGVTKFAGPPKGLEVNGPTTLNGATTINGSPIPRMATGSVYTGNDPGPGANQTHNISFPPGRFTSVPLVQVTSVNTFGRALVSVDNITTSGARVVTQRVGSGWAAGEIHWFATQS